MFLKLSLICSLLCAALSAQAMRLTYWGETVIRTGEKFQKTTIGGISGIAYNEGILYAVSDDKGRDGEPRFYEFTLTLKNKTVELKPKAVHFVTGVPDDLIKKGGLDLEGLFRFPDGDILLSSEGKGSGKPRIQSKIIRLSSDGKWKSELGLPDKFLIETVGEQKKGPQNNRSLESLTGLPDGKTVFTTSESALVQDVKSSEDHLGDGVRIVKYVDDGKGLQVKAEYPYKIDAFGKNAAGSPEFFRGISDMLAVSEDKILVLERGARFIGTTWASTVSIYLADLNGAMDVSQVKSLNGEKITYIPKTRLVDFEIDLATVRKDIAIDNFEALSWGPKLPDGRKTLLVMSDNNFSSKQRTELIVFAVENE